MRNWAKGAGLVVLSLLLAGLWSSWPVSAGHGLVDCDENAVIYCGVHDKTDLARKIKDGDGNPYGRANDLSNLFAARGISEQDIASSVEGTVTKDGRVLVSNQVVATNAMSYGRQEMEGSVLDGTLWKRKTSVSFQSQLLPALVSLDNNKRFRWAVIKSCGNPVIAEPVQIQQPKQTFECRDLSASQSAGTAPLSVSLTAHSKVENAMVQSYYFEFGDGATQQVTSMATSQTVMHTYAQPGTYTAKVKIVTSAGTTEFVSVCQETITVRQVPALSQAPPPPPPAAAVPRAGGDLVGLLASGALSYGAYSYRRSRRELKRSLIQRD